MHLPVGSQLTVQQAGTTLLFLLLAKVGSSSDTESTGTPGVREQQTALGPERSLLVPLPAVASSHSHIVFVLVFRLTLGGRKIFFFLIFFLERIFVAKELNQECDEPHIAPCHCISASSNILHYHNHPHSQSDYFLLKFFWTFVSKLKVHI